MKILSSLTAVFTRYGVLSLPASLDSRLVRATADQLGLEDLVKELLNKETTEEERPGLKGSMTDWLRLNVGGTLFETSRSLTSDPDSILSRMFEPNSNLPPASVMDGVFQIDACPRTFSVILNWLRYRDLVLGEAKVEEVFPVADYFGLKDLREQLESRMEKEKEEQGKMATCVEESVERLEEVLQHIEVELNGINEKLEDFKIEVCHRSIFEVSHSLSHRFPQWPPEWRTSGGSSVSSPVSVLFLVK